MERFGEGALEFGSPLGFGDADEVFRVASRKWRLVLCSAAEAGEKITYGEDGGAFELYDPLPDFQEDRGWLADPRGAVRPERLRAVPSVQRGHGRADRRARPGSGRVRARGRLPV